MPTLDEVARLAGVSLATASRTFGRPDKVDPATRLRVEEAAVRLGYVANSTARALATGTAGLVGIVVPDLRSPYFAPIISAAQGRVERAGLELLVADSRGRPEHEAEILRRLRGRTDGVVLVSPRGPAAGIAEAGRVGSLVTVNRRVPSVDSVSVDAEGGMAELAAYVLGAGRRRLAYVGGPPGSRADRARYAVLASRAEDAGAACEHLGVAEPTPAAGLAVADAVVRSGADAVVAYNALVAHGLTIALRAAGRAVPDEIGVASTDDLIEPGLGPRLTAVRQPMAEAGRRAAELLLGRVAAARDGGAPRPPAHVVLPTELVVGDTL